MRVVEIDCTLYESLPQEAFVEVYIFLWVSSDRRDVMDASSCGHGHMIPREPDTAAPVLASVALENTVYSSHMAKRASQDIKNKKSRSKKTGKRLAAKRAMLAAKGTRRGSVKFKSWKKAR